MNNLNTSPLSPLKVITTTSSIRRDTIIQSVIEGLDSEVVSVKTPTDANQVVEDLSYSTDDSFEIDTTDERKKTVHTVTPTHTPVQPAIPLLKGQYFRDDRFVYWTGKWGMSIDGKISGDTSEFSYHIPCALSKDSSLAPISGVYQGYFWMKYKPPQKIVENKMQLIFTENGKDFLVSGTGSNRLGSYDLQGVYNPETQELSCYKHYHHHPSKTKSHRSDTPKETRSSTRYLNYLVTGGVDIPASIPSNMHTCYRIHTKLVNHKWAFPFMQPVDPVALHIPDYFSIIKNPMDLGTIRTKLMNGEITTEEEYVSLVRLVFNNAIMYNKPQDDVAIMAHALNDYFEKEYRHIQIDLDAPAMITRRRSTKRNGDPISIGSLQKKYSLRGSGSVDVNQRKTTLDLPGDLELYQYQALEAVMKRIQGVLSKKVYDVC